MSRQHRSNPRVPAGLYRAAVVALLIGLAAWRLYTAGDDRPPSAGRRNAPGQAPVGDEPAGEIAPPALAWVKRAVDGDTLLMRDRQRVRLLGVDTPETKRENTPVQPWGPEAHEFTARMVEGKKVRLEFDREHEDRYGRVLAYVYVGDRLLNEELLRAGLGHAILNHPYSEKMKDRFRRAEREARDAKRGLWSTPGNPSRRSPAEVGL